MLCAGNLRNAVAERNDKYFPLDPRGITVGEGKGQRARGRSGSGNGNAPQPREQESCYAVTRLLHNDRGAMRRSWPLDQPPLVEEVLMP